MQLHGAAMMATSSGVRGRLAVAKQCAARPSPICRRLAATRAASAFLQQQTNGASTASTSTTEAPPRVKADSQAYINRCVMPQARATLHVYQFHEDVFKQLLLTPDLDTRLRHDKGLQWAAATVLAAVDEAVDIAFKGGRSHGTSPVAGSASSTARAAAAAGAAAAPGGSEGSAAAAPPESRSSSSSSSGVPSSAESTLGGLGDGMGSAEAAAAHDFFRGHWPAQPSVDEARDAAAGCTSDDEQCVMDWHALGLADGLSGSCGDAQPPPVPGPGATASMSVDSARYADQAAAAAAVKLEAALGEPFEDTAAHTFLQRILYRINRLAHFWYDDLSNYDNERSAWLAAIRQRIETPWQAWEKQQLLAEEAGDGENPWKDLSADEIKRGLLDRFERDVDPPLSAAQQFIAHDMSSLGYAHLLAVGALDGLVEASRQSRVCAGVANDVACTIFRVLMEEYGTGKLSRKHSTFYQKMMEELGLDARPEGYLDLVPWQLLAGANHNFLLTERRRHYLRYAGALSFFETNGPSVYKTYLAAGRRCGLSEDSTGYWALHVREDERHGRQMLEEVALPLVDMYPRDSWELLWGWDQDRFMGSRAGAAVAAHIQAAAANADEQTVG